MTSELLSTGLVDHMHSLESRMTLKHCCAVLGDVKRHPTSHGNRMCLPTCSSHASLQSLGAVPANAENAAAEAPCYRVHL